MQLKGIVLAAGIVSLLAAAGCSTGGSVVLPPASSTNYSNASIKGSYVYQIHGFDTSGNPYRQVGVFTSDGNGNITGGADDSSFGASGTQVKGTYTVAKDGTGFLNFTTSSVGAISLAITLVSTSKIYLIEADLFANAGGTAELQDANAIGAAPTGTFVFRLHQEISAQGNGPSAEVGAVAISNGSGNGSLDENLAGVFSSASLTWTAASPAALGRGTGTFTNSSTVFTTSFVYYIVNSSKFVILVDSVGAVGSGIAELQSGAVGNGLSGSYSFGSRGDTTNFYAGVATVGQFTPQAGLISGTEDISQDGNIASNSPFTSCYTAAANGRVAVTSAPANACSAILIQVFWMVSPSRAFFLNNDSNSVEDGTADLQTAQNFSLSTFSQQFGIVMDGLDLSSEQLLSRIGTIHFDGTGKVVLNEVVNASLSGLTSPGLMAGRYSVSSNGRNVVTMNGGTLDLVMYAVSPSQFYVLQADAGFITSGTLQLQQ